MCVLKGLDKKHATKHEISASIKNIPLRLTKFKSRYFHLNSDFGARSTKADVGNSTENIQVYQGRFSHTVFDVINAIYHDKPLIFIGATFEEKLVSRGEAKENY